MQIVLDENLLNSAREGDTGALNLLMVTCRPKLRLYAIRHCSTSSDVDDAVQETLIILSRKLPALRSLGSFTGWIYTIIRRECQRLSMKMFQQELPIDTIDEKLYLKTRRDEELQMDIVMAIQSLPSLYRDVIVLRDFEDLTIREIAERLNMQPDTVKTRIHRGRHLIREHLLS